jgi:hypothetical protein
MMITDAMTAEKIGAYLQHEISLDDLVDWAETALMDGTLAENETDELAEVLARLGLADVRNFGLSWEDCEALLHQLGYKAQVQILSQ